MPRDVGPLQSGIFRPSPCARGTDDRKPACRLLCREDCWAPHHCDKNETEAMSVTDEFPKRALSEAEHQHAADQLIANSIRDDSAGCATVASRQGDQPPESEGQRPRKSHEV